MGLLYDYHVLLTMGFVKGTDGYVDLPHLIAPIFVFDVV